MNKIDHRCAKELSDFHDTDWSRGMKMIFGTLELSSFKRFSKQFHCLQFEIQLWMNFVEIEFNWVNNGLNFKLFTWQNCLYYGFLDVLKLFESTWTQLLDSLFRNKKDTSRFLIYQPFIKLEWEFPDLSYFEIFIQQRFILNSYSFSYEFFQEKGLKKKI